MLFECKHSSNLGLWEKAIEENPHPLVMDILYFHLLEILPFIKSLSPTK